ncbi:MAG: hypothetical protein WA949_02310 [Phormidesmis sp.]
MNTQKLSLKRIFVGALIAAPLIVPFTLLAGPALASRASLDVNGVAPTSTIRILRQHRAQLAASHHAASTPVPVGDQPRPLNTAQPSTPNNGTMR